MTSIPFLDLKRLHASIRDDLDDAYDRALRSSGFVGGVLVREFEDAFAGAHGAAGAAGCASGTDALTLTLRALGIGTGDEVVVPAMTFVATAEAVVHAGATPVLADVDPRTLLITDTCVREVETDKTKAVIPVHLYGHVVPFDVIEAWRGRGLRVIEDAAQAHLATWRGCPVGSAGDAACFSFYPGKNLGALGDGGLVLSNDRSLVDEVKLLRDHGRRSKYEHEVVGWCSRLDGLQGAFLLAKLRHMDTWNERRIRAAQCYRERLGDRLVPWEEGAVHHVLVARVGPSERSAIRTALADSGIATALHYPVALSRQRSLEQWCRPCEASERAANEVLSLPMDPLLTLEEVEYVCDRFEELS